VKLTLQLALFAAVGLLVCAVLAASTHTGQAPPCTSGVSWDQVGRTAGDHVVSTRLHPSVSSTPSRLKRASEECPCAVRALPASRPGSSA